MQIERYYMMVKLYFVNHKYTIIPDANTNVLKHRRQKNDKVVKKQTNTVDSINIPFSTLDRKADRKSLRM